jgi:large subunit ribosomal protein L2
MGIKIYKPISNARRHMSVDAYSDLSAVRPEKSLLAIKKKSGGRNSYGRITVRHIGGGEKQFIRLIDFKRDKFEISAKVASIEYDPSRKARLALLNYADGEKRYIVSPVDLTVGMTVISSLKNVPMTVGNATKLENIPVGTFIYNLELEPGRGGKLVRSAGNQAKIMAVEGRFAQVKLPSGEVRLLPKECLATIGQVSNPDAMHVRVGKAGRMRHWGVKPRVRGKAMNPVDHPHGGGEGRNPIGMKRPKTPWGKPALGVKTRSSRPSDKLILTRRKK